MESGRTHCRRDFAQCLDRAFRSGTTMVEAWDELLESVKSIKYPEFFVNFPKAEQSAIMLRAYEERIVHGLLQREAYARVLLDDEDAIKNRMRRQEILERDPLPMISIIMDETVLYREVGSSFAIATRPDHKQVAYGIKAWVGETTTNADEIATAAETFVILQSEALNVRETRSLITEVIEKRWT